MPFIDIVMHIDELTSLSDSQVEDLLALMRELDPEITVTAEMVRAAAKAPGTHLFVAREEAGSIIGCASLCVFESPTGRKASIEDVVVGEAYRGRGIGRALVEQVVDYAGRELAPVDLHLTSRPARVAANGLYRKLGFVKRETNVYRMHLPE